MKFLPFEELAPGAMWKLVEHRETSPGIVESRVLPNVYHSFNSASVASNRLTNEIHCYDVIQESTD